MKKASYFLASALAVALIFANCSKDQKVVKELDGKWKVTSETVNGTASAPSTYENDEYSFSVCKVKKGDCDGTITDGTFTLPFKYKISDKGKTFTMTFNVLGTNETETATITEHSKSKFVFSEDKDGKTTVTTLEKK